jgi:serine protease AprX
VFIVVIQKIVMQEPKKSNPNMEYRNGKSASTGTSGQNDKIRVMLQIRVPRGQPSMAFESPALNIQGLELDKSYSPVPLKPSPETSFGMEAEGKEVVVVRGTIDNKAKLEELKRQPGVVRVDDDPKIAPFSPPDGQPDCQPGSAHGTLQDVANYLRVNEIWNAGRRGAGIVVAIADCGITAEGRPVKSGETSNRITNVIGGWPSQDWGTKSSDWEEHGNMCATDVLGIAPEASLYDIRITGPTDIEGLLSDALQGFRWAVDQYKQNKRPHIISNSWGIWQENWAPIYARDPNHSFTLIVLEAIETGIIVLFAAGNCGDLCPTNPKCGSDTGPGKSIWGANGHQRVITVGAANREEQYIGYSSQGPSALGAEKPDFCSISHFDGYFTSDNGTSAACPIAAGVMALLKQAKPSLTQDEAMTVLKNTAKDIGSSGPDPYAGSGIIRPKVAYDSL